jgi:hypothetical protein
MDGQEPYVVYRTSSNQEYRGLRDKGRLGIRFKRSEDNSPDIMANNLLKEAHERHTHTLRKGIYLAGGRMLRVMGMPITL